MAEHPPLSRAEMIGGVVAGLIVLLVQVLPILAIWWAGRSGSVGDLGQVELLGAGLVVSAGLAALTGWLMMRALRRARLTSEVGRYDPWFAFFLALSILILGLSLAPGLMWVILVGDENQAIRGDQRLFELLWFGFEAVAFALAVLGGWLVLRRRRPSTVPAA